jgi:hypothetical protein
MRAPKTPANGKITRGITPHILLEKTIAFVEQQLPKWRDDKTRELADAEEVLNGQLCKFLNDRARMKFPMAFFHHEEKQAPGRRVDISALPTLEVTKAMKAGLYQSIYDPIFVIEGKRLPSPARAREREYLTGFKDMSGGVQRFRLCLHGKAHSTAMLVGYIQSGDAKSWHKKLNTWINSLADSAEDSTCTWTKQDEFGKLSTTCNNRTFRCQSKHSRTGVASDIRLVHLWTLMPSKAVRRKSV